MTEQRQVTGHTRDLIILLQKLILILARFWSFIALMAAIAILALGFLAPAFMASGQPETGQAIYRFLAPHNHQLPQRSYFLFGQVGRLQTYSLDQILAHELRRAFHCRDCFVGVINNRLDFVLQHVQ